MVMVDPDKNKTYNKLLNYANKVGDLAVTAYTNSEKYLQKRDLIIKKLQSGGISKEESIILVNKLVKFEQKARLNLEACKILLNAHKKIENKIDSLNELAGNINKVEIVTNAVDEASHDERKEILIIATRNESEIVNRLTTDELLQALPAMNRIGTSLMKIAGNDNDLVRMVNVHQDAMLADIANKILPQGAKDVNYVESCIFLDSLKKQPVEILKSDLTQKILDMIEKRMHDNMVADELAHNIRTEKKSEGNKIDKRKDAKRTDLRKDLQNKIIQIKVIINAEQKLDLEEKNEDQDEQPIQPSDDAERALAAIIYGLLNNNKI